MNERFFSVYRRMSPYTTRRYTIVIRPCLLDLGTHCCFQPGTDDIDRLNECNGYIEELLYKSVVYESIKTCMKHVRSLSRSNKKTDNIELKLKNICRYEIRHLIRERKLVLVQMNHQLNLNSKLFKYVKFII